MFVNIRSEFSLLKGLVLLCSSLPCSETLYATAEAIFKNRRRLPSTVVHGLQSDRLSKFWRTEKASFLNSLQDIFHRLNKADMLGKRVTQKVGIIVDLLVTLYAVRQEAKLKLICRIADHSFSLSCSRQDTACQTTITDPCGPR